MTPSDPHLLAAAVKSEAHRQGFGLAGVTTPDPPACLDVYQQWLRAGHHGEMAYLATERAWQRRSDPRRILPECRSILVVAVNYPPAAPVGQVAAYAQGDDYHSVLTDRLSRLITWLEGQAGHPIPHKVYTDTGPVLERELAQRAGLGWIGKNSCLIHPRRGSFVLLAEALLGIELAPDPPSSADHCGSCTRCLDACPTSCILPNRTLDARRCISYLTIELKGSIPPDLRPAVGEWLFGCDICQRVCPWNRRFGVETQDPAFQTRPILAKPDPIRLLEMSPRAFQQAMRDSPLLRPRRRGILRNAAVMLGNRRLPGAVPALAGVLLEEGEPLVRGHAAWALGRIGRQQAASILTQARATESDPGVLAEIEASLNFLASSNTDHQCPVPEVR
jgi:epoxyqueuosine reductase